MKCLRSVTIGGWRPSRMRHFSCLESSKIHSQTYLLTVASAPPAALRTNQHRSPFPATRKHRAMPERVRLHPNTGHSRMARLYGTRRDGSPGFRPLNEEDDDARYKREGWDPRKTHEENMTAKTCMPTTAAWNGPSLSPPRAATPRARSATWPPKAAARTRRWPTSRVVNSWCPGRCKRRSSWPPCAAPPKPTAYRWKGCALETPKTALTRTPARRSFGLRG